MEVRYFGRKPQDGVACGFEPSVEALARWADFLVVATSGGPETRHLISAGVLEALGPQGYLINIARGTVVDEAALVDALTHKRIAGAGLDVFENQPRTCPRRCSGWTTWCCCPTWPAVPTRRARPWPTLVFENLEAFFASGAVLKSAL